MKYWILIGILVFLAAGCNPRNRTLNLTDAQIYKLCYETLDKYMVKWPGKDDASKKFTCAYTENVKEDGSMATNMIYTFFDDSQLSIDSDGNIKVLKQ